MKLNSTKVFFSCNDFLLGFGDYPLISVNHKPGAWNKQFKNNLHNHHHPVGLVILFPFVEWDGGYTYMGDVEVQGT